MAETSTDNDKALIEDVLKKGSGEIAFEAPIDEDESPMNESVVDKDKTSPGPPLTNEGTIDRQNGQNQPLGESNGQATVNAPQTPLDAPEQEINAEAASEHTGEMPKESPEGFTVSLEHAQLMADTMLGVTNNVLEVGGGYFITIRKHKEFYDFDEVIQIIDEQNVKNIKRLKLDEEDKALLRPLLVQVLRKQTKAISVESQLIAVALSIVMKKARVVMEIRAENEVMVDRIREVIRRELAAAAPNAMSGDNTQQDHDDDEEEEADEEEEPETVMTEVTEKRRTPQAGYAQNGIPASVLETNPHEHQ